MRSKILAIMILILSLNIVILIAQEEVAEEAVSTDVIGDSIATDQVSEETLDIKDAPEIKGAEALARKIVGGGLVDKFIQGGLTMWPILFLLIWAVANIIWKFVVLSYAKINVNNLMKEIIPLIEEKKFHEASEYCAKQRGPVASILHQGLLKAEKGIEAVEKNLENAGILEMAFLEKGFMSLSTTISLAPMFGFFGTLAGMISAFDAIEKAGEVDPTIVASGIKVALITSAAGLAVAIPVQLFNNIFLSMVDGLVIDMQKGSEALVETLVENK